LPVKGLMRSHPDSENPTTMPYKPHETEKIYWTIGEVADMFSVNASLIRFWEKEFDIISPHKNKKGDRMFTREDVENIRIIYHLVKERGFTLQGAREKLKQNKGDTTNTVEVVRSLKKIREFLVELRKELPGGSDEPLPENLDEHCAESSDEDLQVKNHEPLPNRKDIPSKKDGQSTLNFEL